MNILETEKKVGPSSLIFWRDKGGRGNGWGGIKGNKGEVKGDKGGRDKVGGVKGDQGGRKRG